MAHTHTGKGKKTAGIQVQSNDHKVQILAGDLMQLAGFSCRTGECKGFFISNLSPPLPGGSNPAASIQNGGRRERCKPQT